MAGFIRLLRSKFVLPADPTTSFSSKTVLLTGGTTGLGLEAAIKFLSLGASTVILGARNPPKAAAAVATISTRAGPHKGIVKVFDLDMSNFASVKAFAARVEKEVERVDVALLNAGVTTRYFERSKEGWEQTLQVNTLSTALLAVLLLPKLRSCQEQSGEPAHLAITSSGLHSVAKEEWFEVPDTGTILEKLSAEEGFERGRQYSASKILVEYVVQELAMLATEENGEVSIVVNSLCPGFCQSDLGRQFDGFWEKVAMWVFMGIFARSTEAGSRTLVSATTRGIEAQGKFWKNDEYPDTGPLRKNKEVQERMWKEIVNIMSAQAPETRQILSKG